MTCDCFFNKLNIDDNQSHSKPSADEEATDFFHEMSTSGENGGAKPSTTSEFVIKEHQIDDKSERLNFS